MYAKLLHVSFKISRMHIFTNYRAHFLHAKCTFYCMKLQNLKNKGGIAIGVQLQ